MLDKDFMKDHLSSRNRRNLKRKRGNSEEDYGGLVRIPDGIRPCFTVHESPTKEQYLGYLATMAYQQQSPTLLFLYKGLSRATKELEAERDNARNQIAKLEAAQ